jgi:polysaccharide biosynthesis transport protein
VIPDKMLSEPDGDPWWHRWNMHRLKLNLPFGGGGPSGRSGRRLAGLTARQFRRAPGVPGSWSRFVIAHARWILVITFIAMAGAALLARSQTPLYTSEAVVYVGFTAAEGGSLQAPDMATEKGIAESGIVLAPAAHNLHVQPAQLASGLSVTVPASTYLMQIFYSNPSPAVAQERAQAIADAYVKYRSPQSQSNAKTAKSAAPLPVAYLVTLASLPKSTSSPDYFVDILAALIVGLGLGLGTAGIRDHLDDHLRGPHELEALAHAPVLAFIPAFRSDRRHPESRLAVAVSPDSVVAEAYRTLRTRLVQTAASKGARTLLVTSPSWEDKSTVAANLAASLAQAGYRTILVCADLRWGFAHELLGVENWSGLTNVLGWRTETATELRKTRLPRLRVLPPGPPPSDPAAVLQQPALRTVMGELRAHADFVIIDAPSLLAGAETGPLSDLAEMILLVGDARSSKRAQVEAAVRHMQAEGKVIGWVLDNVGRHRHLPRPRRPIEDIDRPLPDEWPHFDPVYDGLRAGLPHHDGNGADGTAVAGKIRKITREDSS